MVGAGTVAVGAGVWVVLAVAVLVGGGAGAILAFSALSNSLLGAIATLIVWGALEVLVGGGTEFVWLLLFGIVVKTHRLIGFSFNFALGISFLTTAVGMSLGMGFKVGLLNSLIILVLTGTTIPLVAMMIDPPLRQAKLIAKYRQSEQQRIKP